MTMVLSFWKLNLLFAGLQQLLIFFLTLLFSIV